MDGKKKLEELVAGLDGVTPGPWDVMSSLLVRALDGDVAIPLFEPRVPWKKRKQTKTVMREEWHNAHHVARCDPDTIRSISDAYKALEAERDALRDFAKWAIRESAFEAADLDGLSVQEKAVELGLLEETTYDPEKHGPSDSAYRGVPWFVFTPILKGPRAMKDDLIDQCARALKEADSAASSYEDLANALLAIAHTTGQEGGR